MNDDLSLPVQDCITREDWYRLRDDEPVHIVQPERAGWVGES